MNKALLIVAIMAVLFAIILQVKTCQHQEKTTELGLKVSVVEETINDIEDYYRPELEGLCPT